MGSGLFGIRTRSVGSTDLALLVSNHCFGVTPVRKLLETLRGRIDETLAV